MGIFDTLRKKRAEGRREIQEVKELLTEGMNLVEKGRYEEALRRFDRAIQLDPRNIGAWYFKGNALGRLERYEDSLKCLDRAMEISSKQGPTKLSLLLFRDRGLSLFSLGRYDDALQSFEKVIEVSPRHEVSWHHKAMTLANLGRPDEALKCVDEAIALIPDSKDLPELREHVEALRKAFPFRERPDAIVLGYRKVEDAKAHWDALIEHANSSRPPCGLRIDLSQLLAEPEPRSTFNRFLPYVVLLMFPWGSGDEAYVWGRETYPGGGAVLSEDTVAPAYEYLEELGRGNMLILRSHIIDPSVGIFAPFAPPKEGA